MKDALGLTKYDYRRLKILQKIDNWLSSRFMLPVYTLYFGYDKAVRLKQVKHDRIKWLNECYSILCEDFADFIRDWQFSQDICVHKCKYIWVCWLQGKNSMPDVVKYCIKSIEQNAPNNTEVKLITSNNLKDYIEFPNFIYQKLKSGSLSMTHFSDLIRMALLRKYGGLWIDATVFVSSQIPREYIDCNLYSIQNLSNEERYRNPYYGGVTSFLVGGTPECMLFDFSLSFFIEYQKRYDHLLDVHLINLCYRLAYDNFPEIRKLVDAIGVNNCNVQSLYKVINSPYSEELWNKTTENQIFHKLNWRSNYREQVNGKQTMWGYIKNLE